MNIRRFAKTVALGALGLALAGSVLAEPVYSFRIWFPGIAASGMQSSASDPYWSEVSALLPLNGTNGSSGVVDEAGSSLRTSGVTFTSQTSALGGSSAAFTGQSAIQVDASDKFNLTGDFTIEGFTNFSVVGNTDTFSPSNQYIFDIGQNGTFLRWYYASGWDFYYGAQRILTYANTPKTNHWYYWVLQRRGSTVDMFLDGTKVQTGTYSGPMGGNQALTLGDFGGGNIYGLQGYMDEVRVTNGVARYTTSAPIPTTEFPTQ
jgi:hypothetical protein